MSMHNETPQQVESVLKEVSAIVSKLAGIQLGPKQQSMVESRVRSRMVKLKIKSITDYMKYVHANFDRESMALLSLLTTHHTFFFREFAHFEYMLNHALPQAIERVKERGEKKIRIWSAASSRGQEAYSLAMFMRFHLAASAPELDFEIWGTDVDPESVKWAQNGVYRAEELKQAPAMYVEGNWVRGTGKVRDYSKVQDHLKAKCKFKTANLLSVDSFLADKSFDIIFCRNVFIYFDSNQIKQITSKLLKHLDIGGFLFLGVSESLNGMGLPVQGVGPSIYRHPAKSIPPSVQKIAMAAPIAEPIYRVLCVDDSPVIHTLLKKILGDKSGFKVVATANNGQEAIDILKTTKVDIITLDMHMPEMDGLGFLSNYQDRSAPIVVVSSINRDDTSIAKKAMSLGASDYVEKPSLENIGQATNEIRSKLKTVITLAKAKNRVAAAGASAGSPGSSTSSPLAPAAPTAAGKVIPSPQPGAKKKVLIVDDSATIRQLLEKVISQDPELEVVAKAEKPSEVEDLIRKHSPNLITLDIHMPEMDGVTLLKKIFPKYGIPTVMISSISREEGPQVLQALECGAIDYIQKPEMGSLAQLAPQIRERLRTAAQSQYKKRSSSLRKARELSGDASQGLILIGSSTGGTEAIRVVLESMPRKIPPILIVQHIPAGFSAALAKRLNDLVPFDVAEAVDGEEVVAGRVLIAPGNTQMGVKVISGKLHVTVRDDGPVNRHKPSVDYLFRSVAKLGLTKMAAAILTGMGADGARGLKELRLMGVRTVAQDEATCVVFGMPREAIQLGAAEAVQPLDKIADTLMSMLNESASDKKSKKAA